MRVERICNAILTIVTTVGNTKDEGIINYKLTECGMVRYADFKIGDEKLTEELKSGLLTGFPVTLLIERSEIDNRDKVIKILRITRE